MQDPHAAGVTAAAFPGLPALRASAPAGEPVAHHSRSRAGRGERRRGGHAERLSQMAVFLRAATGRPRGARALVAARTIGARLPFPHRGAADAFVALGIPALHAGPRTHRLCLAAAVFPPCESPLPAFPRRAHQRRVVQLPLRLAAAGGHRFFPPFDHERAGLGGGPGFHHGRVPGLGLGAGLHPFCHHILQRGHDAACATSHATDPERFPGGGRRCERTCRRPAARQQGGQTPCHGGAGGAQFRGGGGHHPDQKLPARCALPCGVDQAGGPELRLLCGAHGGLHLALPERRYRSRRGRRLPGRFRRAERADPGNFPVLRPVGRGRGRFGPHRGGARHGDNHARPARCAQRMARGGRDCLHRRDLRLRRDAAGAGGLQPAHPGG